MNSNEVFILLAVFGLGFSFSFLVTHEQKIELTAPCNPVVVTAQKEPASIDWSGIGRVIDETVKEM